MKLYDLLPQSPNTILHSEHEEQTVINRVLYFVKLFSKAKSAFMSGMLHNFDAHVGETCCQIRAYGVALAYKNRKNNNVFKTLNQDIAISILQNLKLVRSRVVRKRSMQVTIKEIFTQLEMDLGIQEEEVFLLTSYFLHAFKKDDHEGISQSIDTSSFITTESESKSYAQNLFRHFQSLNSQLSISLVNSWFLDLKGLVSLITTPKILSKFLKTSEHSRSVYPCFCITEIILNHILHVSKISVGIILSFEKKCASVPILVNVNSSNSFEFSPCRKTSERPAFLIRASTGLNNLQDFFCKMKILDLLDVLLCVAADHPQFSGRKLQNFSSFRDSHFESSEVDFYISYLSFKQKARVIGVSACNPEFFFVKHYLACVANKLKLLSNKFPIIKTRHYCEKSLLSKSKVNEEEII